MQQAGSSESQPLGQVAFTGPPKQRRMPFESGLQTGLPLPLPSKQQFWEAFTSVDAPQMLPGGLQAPPPSQVWSAVQWTAFGLPSPGGLRSWLMLQQDAVVSQ
jgi:hypothetical protein